MAEMDVRCGQPRVQVQYCPVVVNRLLEAILGLHEIAQVRTNRGIGGLEFGRTLVVMLRFLETFLSGDEGAQVQECAGVFGSRLKDRQVSLLGFVRPARTMVL